MKLFLILQKILYKILLSDSGGVCITENEPDGYCRESQMKELAIDYKPLSDKHQLINEILI